MSQGAPPPSYPPPSYPPPPRSSGSGRGRLVAVVAGVVAVLVAVAVVLVVVLAGDDGDDDTATRGSGDQAGDRPGDTVVESYELARARDCDVIDLYSEQAQAELEFDEAACESEGEGYFEEPEPTGCEIEVTDESVDGDTAEVVYSISGCDDAEQNRDAGTFELVREDGEWKLDGPPEIGEATDDDHDEPERVGETPQGTAVAYFALLAERDCRVTFTMSSKLQAQSGGDGAQCAADPDAYFGVSNTVGCEFDPSNERIDGGEATVDFDVSGCDDPAGDDIDVVVHLVEEDGGWLVDRFTELE